MKVKVKDIAVFHEGKRYEKGQEVEIKKDDFNEDLFKEVEAKKKSDK